MSQLAKLFLSRWRLVLYAIVASILAVAIAWFSRDLGLKAFDLIAKNQSRHLAGYFAQEKDFIAERVESFSRSEELKLALVRDDIPAIKALIDRERGVTGMPAFTVTDEGGTVLLRSPVAANTGDNIFLTIPLGRARSPRRYIYHVQPGAGFSFGFGCGQTCEG